MAYIMYLLRVVKTSVIFKFHLDRPKIQMHQHVAHLIRHNEFFVGPGTLGFHKYELFAHFS